MRGRVPDELAGRLTFVAARTVGNHDVVGCQDRGKALADPGGEGVSVVRPVDERAIARHCSKDNGERGL